MIEERSIEISANRCKIDEFLGLAPGAAPKKISPSEFAMKASKTFSEKRPKSSLEWNDATGTPRWLIGDLSLPMPGTVSEVGLNFLLENSALMGISDAAEDLAEVDSFDWGGMQHVRFQQTFAGLPVFGAEAMVSMDQNKKVTMVGTAFVKDISLKPEKEPISAKEAAKIAMEDLGKALGKEPVLRGRTEHDTVIYPTADGHAKVYHLLMPAEEPLGDWEYFVDIQSGEIVDSFNSMRFLLPYAGRARVYPENPDNTALLTHMLGNLYYPYRMLNGRFCRVFNEDGPEAVAGMDYRFDHPPENTHFDESQVYYAVEKTYAYFRSLGFRGFLRNNPYGRTRNGQLGAHVHVGTNYNNAFYSRTTGMVYFGDGSYNGSQTGLKDLAKSLDVVAHEFTHAVIDELNRYVFGRWGGALHEGYSDYFAASLSDDPKVGEYVNPEEGPQGIIRTCHNSKEYPGNAGDSVHELGKIWSGGCWDLRVALGQPVADYLIFGSIVHLPPLPTFKTAKDTLMRVDRHHCGGEYKATIKRIFEEERKIPV
jgi:Zn-dependent metalloprotease